MRRALVATGQLTRGQCDEALGVDAQRQRKVVRQRLAQGIAPGDAGHLGPGGWWWMAVNSHELMGRGHVDVGHGSND